MQYLALILFLPILWPFIAKLVFGHSTILWKEVGLNVLIVVVIVTAGYAMALANKTQAVETINGYITDKQREHGHYQRPYDCFCTTSCSGTGSNRSCTRLCQTCYEDRYTVKWYAKSTIGNFTFDSLDRGSRSVYNTPDPAVYTNCTVGEPAARSQTYVNYIKATPESVFSLTQQQHSYNFPAYPRPHSFYKINRVVTVGDKMKVDTSYIDKLNTNLNNALREMGATKEVNFIVILTNYDQNFRYALEERWLGGEKNDAVVFLGVNDDMSLEWVDVMTWALNSGNELYQVTLRDNILDLGTASDPDAIANTIVKTTGKLYDRPQMKKFEYLKESITPSTGAMFFLAAFGLVVSIGLSIFFHRNDMEGESWRTNSFGPGAGFRRRNRWH